MTTQFGRHYRETEVQVIENMAAEATGVNNVMRILLEDRRNRELQIEEERRQRERAIAEEREQLREQMDVLWKLIEGSQQDFREGRPVRGCGEGELKLSKLNDQDDIEAYLTSFERVMRISEVPEDRCAVRLAPQLMGKAQSVYAAMGAEDALDYLVLKEAILKRYDISEDTYKHRFRRTEKELVSKLVVRLNDDFRKWTRECDTVEQLADLMVMEQLLNTLPENVKIWVEERRPKTSEEAARLADDYLRARKQTKLTKPAGPEDKAVERNTR